MLRELSVVEQRYQAVLAVIEDGFSVTEAAVKTGVSRQTLNSWLGRYAAGGVEVRLVELRSQVAGVGVEVAERVQDRGVGFVRGQADRLAAVGAVPDPEEAGVVAVGAGVAGGRGPFPEARTYGLAQNQAVCRPRPPFQISFPASMVHSHQLR